LGYHPYQHIVGHFRDESFQSIIFTETDNLTRTAEYDRTQK